MQTLTRSFRQRSHRLRRKKRQEERLPKRPRERLRKERHPRRVHRILIRHPVREVRPAIRRVGIRLPVILPIGRQAVEHRIRIRTILLRSQVHPSQVHLSRVQVPVRILPQVQEIPVRRAGSSARQEAVLVHRMYGQETHQV